MQKLIKERLEDLKDLCIKYNVQTMYIFGSACTENFNENSDIDILISFKDISIEEYTDNYFELHYQLEKLFKRRIDLMTERSIDNPYLIDSIEKTKELVYAA
ncbi:MAG: nucleotidyltransferase family protein [Spirochaetota bacterium]